MSTYKTLDDLQNISGQTILLRVDINVPMDGDAVSDTTRIERVAPTILELSDKGAKVILLAHYGRPKGTYVAQMSLGRIVSAVSEVLGRSIDFVGTKMPDAIKSQIDEMENGGILMMENLRFHPGEESNDPQYAGALAAMGQIYVNDAFSAAHRAHASTEGIARLLPSYAGRTMQAELEALQAGLGDPKSPVVALVGGAKVSTKLDLLENLVAKVDHLIIGGGMANTFLSALGHGVGNSLCEKDLAETALQIVAAAKAANCEIILPEDVVVADSFAANSPNDVVEIDAVPDDRMILDAGPKSVALISGCIEAAKTLVWNGPLGAFELEPFDRATNAAAKAAANATNAGTLISVAGGGDTVAALKHAGVDQQFTYVSTAGGAFLEWMEGKTLPGVAALTQ